VYSANGWYFYRPFISKRLAQSDQLGLRNDDVQAGDQAMMVSSRIVDFDAFAKFDVRP